jgi:hypothetical protein
VVVVVLRAAMTAVLMEVLTVVLTVVLVRGVVVMETSDTGGG